MTDLIWVKRVSSYQQTTLYIHTVNRLIMYICFYCYPLFLVSHFISSQLNLPIKLVLTISIYPKLGYLLPSSHHSLLGCLTSQTTSLHVVVCFPTGRLILRGIAILKVCLMQRSKLSPCHPHCLGRTTHTYYCHKVNHIFIKSRFSK